MANFKPFSKAVFNQFNKMSENNLFVVDIDPYELTDLYLDSFPAGTNEIFRERREYDCSCCKNFIRKVGNVVSIKNGKLETIWDVNVPYPFDKVCKVLLETVKSAAIKTVFLHNEKRVGTEYNHEQMPDGDIKRWDHFYCDVDDKFFTNEVGEKRSAIESATAVFQRGLKELSLEALETVKDLIDDKALYRGEEHLQAVTSFITVKRKYEKLKNDSEKSIFVWENHTNKSVRFKNSVIGTLVSDISGGVELEKAVKAFESKVAPANYKRSSALITKRMVDNAMTTVDKLGIEDSLSRRHATVEDVTVNNVIWANRGTQSKMKGGLSDLLMSEVKDTAKVDESKITEVSIYDFISNVVPKSTSIKLMVSNAHTGNFMTVTAPAISGSKNIFKWDNNFGWSYNGDITDSIKQRVKAAGGNVDAKLRVSLSWYNTDDLDIHCKTPNGEHIYYGNKRGILDVDMNVNDLVRDPVENLAFQSLRKGDYKISVKNYTKRESVDVGFTVEMECGGHIETFNYEKAVRNTQMIDVIDLTWTGSDVKVKKVHNGVVGGSLSKDVWGIKSETFVDVNMLMLSPNHWDGNNISNKHWFFIINDCKNPDSLRGFYNEFLSGDLNKHRKVFEVLGSKTKCEYSDNQLSGLGFSSTKEDSVVVKVEGEQNRMYKVNF